MIISAKVVKPRKPRRCWDCGLPIVTRAVRLYGCCEGDPPYVLWSHVDCVSNQSDPKIRRALETAGETP